MFVGLVVSFAGLAIAMWSIHDLSNELFDHPLLPLSRLLAMVKRLIHRVLKGKPPPTPLDVDDGMHTVTSDLKALWSIGKKAPDDDAPLTEWNDYWEFRVGRVEKKLERMSNEMRNADQEISDRLTDESEARLKDQEESKNRLQRLLAGSNGSGLVKTWWGLAVTGFGTVLQAVGVAIS